LCDRDIATNFGTVAGEVILVDSCAVIFIYCDFYLFFLKKKEENFCLRRYCSLTAAVLFKTYFLVELGIGLLFPEGKQRSEQD
jgi:dolichyl-phosphate-mannose--protein O-mannosyl transferase